MDNTPRHIAMILDGNRRWAKERGLPSFEGHRTAAEKTLPALIDVLEEEGVRYVTLWTLSTENLISRSKDEIAHLMTLLRHFLRTKIKELYRKNMRIATIGDISKLPDDIQKELAQAVEMSKTNTGMTVIFALNYGGRNEMLRAMQKLIASGIDAQAISVERFSAELDTADIPDPDLVIRTGGEKRTSGFLLWQAEYAEYAFVDAYLPDFTPEMLRTCIDDYANRKRRFGA